MPLPTHLRVLEPAQSGRKRYSEDFRRHAVAQVEAGRPIAEVARSLEVSRNTLKAWLEDARREPMAPLASVLESDLRGSRREVLTALRDSVASLIVAGLSGRDMPANARLLMEITQELESLRTREEVDAEVSIEDEPFDPAMI